MVCLIQPISSECDYHLEQYSSDSHPDLVECLVYTPLTLSTLLLVPCSSDNEATNLYIQIIRGVSHLPSSSSNRAYCCLRVSSNMRARAVCQQFCG